ncbi:MAG: hypothetical protein R6T99_09530 [Bacteroidales bacterium]
MYKQMYLFRGAPSMSRSSFKEQIWEITEKAACDASPCALSFTVTETNPPGISVIPFGKQNMACVSVYRKTNTPLDPLIHSLECTEAFAVKEARPVDHQRKWNSGEATPGSCLLTLFRKKRSIDYPVFIKRWHEGHTPLTLRVHPIWHYSRNVVTKKLKSGTKWYDGIVEEHTRKPSDLLNPARFFGNPLTMLYHMLEVFVDVKSFIDYGSIETYLTKEYHIR